MSSEAFLKNAFILAASVGGGYWLVSQAVSKEMLAEHSDHSDSDEPTSDVFPADRERMKYAATAAQTVIPYALYEGAQGSLYRDFVFDGQAHLPSDAPLYSRPALTTLNYDRAFGSGPARILDLPYRIHEGNPVELSGTAVSGSYATPAGGVPAGEFSAEEVPVFFFPAGRVPNGLETLTELDLSEPHTDSWNKVGYNNKMPTYPLVEPRTNSIVSSVIDDAGGVVTPEGQYLSYGRDSPLIYSPFTFMQDTPDNDRYYSDGTETKSRHEWEQDYAIYGYGDQSISLASRSGMDSRILRRR